MSTDSLAVAQPPLKTLNGKYWVGMRRNEAKKVEIFDRIDTDKDGVLSGKEICDNRDLVNTNNSIHQTGLTVTGFILEAAACAIVGILEVSLFPLAAPGLLLVGGAQLWNMLDGSGKENRETKEYRERNGLNTET